MNATLKMIGRLAAVAGTLGALCAAGCVSYASYPPVPKNTAINDPNAPAMEEVMMVGLRWVAAKYPPGGQPAVVNGEIQPAPPVAVNLPKGVKPKVYERVAKAMGPSAKPLDAETSHWPIYHVDSLRIRGDQANIWIFRPAPELGMTPAGTPVYQEVKLWLRGGLQPWHVISVIERTPGESEIPEPNFYEPEPPPTKAQSKAAEEPYRPRPKAPAEPAANQPVPAPADAQPATPPDAQPEAPKADAPHPEAPKP